MKHLLLLIAFVPLSACSTITSEGANRESASVGGSGGNQTQIIQNRSAESPRQIAEYLLDNEPAMIKENCLYMRQINASGYSVYSSSFREEALTRLTQRGMEYQEAERFHNAVVIAVSRMCPDVR
jgi:hypothetical protein